MTKDKHEELARLRRLAKRELAAVQRYHDAMRSIAAAFAVGDLSMITRILNELDYTTSATALRAEPASTPTSYVTNWPTAGAPQRAQTLLKQLDGLSTEDVRKRLNDEALPLGELRGLASELGVAAAGRSSRANLVQQLTLKVANYFAYWRLGCSNGGRAHGKACARAARPNNVRAIHNGGGRCHQHQPPPDPEA
jgi:hypothetical protein